MEWIVTTARTVDEAQTRALDLLGVDLDDAEIQVIEEGKTGLFGRTKSEARVRARIKPKAPPVKEERRSGRNDRNRNRNRGGRGKGNNNRNSGGGNSGGNSGGGNDRTNNNRGDGGGRNKNRGGGGGGGGGAAAAAVAGAGAASSGGNRGNGGNGGGNNRGGNADGGNSGGRNRNRNRDRNRNRNEGDRGRQERPDREDREEMPVAEQRETLEAFVRGVAEVFDADARVELVEDGTTLIAEVHGDNLGRLVGPKAQTLQTLQEVARTAMHRAAAGRRYHRIQVDVDSYRARRREALARFATGIAEQVAASGESKAMEPMSAADRKLVHDAVADVAGVETVSEGRDPRRYIVILPLDRTDEEE